ncbi:MAG: family 43 glycosylhydrolase [Myxococcales bacterium]
MSSAPGVFPRGSVRSFWSQTGFAPASLFAVVLAAGCAGGVEAGPVIPGTGGKSATGGTSGEGSGGNHVGTGGRTPDVGGTGGAGGGGTTGGNSTGGGSPIDGSGGSAPQGGSNATGGAPPVSSGGTVIVNDTFWKDTTGQNIYSQGGGVLRVGDTYYWYGYRYGNAATYATGMQTPIAAGVTTYSSTDLVNWKPESVSMMEKAGGWFGRLGVVYHTATKKYVLAAQGGGGLYFGTADAPGGPFVYNNVQATMPGVANGGTGDQTMFQDDDGAAYVVSSSSNGRANRYLSPLRASDFLAAEQAIPVYSGGGREGNCMFKYQGTYYFCSSDLHGWNTSTTYCVSSSSVKGPWSAEFVLDGTQMDYSHVTQTGFFIAVKGTDATTIIFAGDRWANFASNGIGYNQWMPLSFDGKTAHFHSLSKWSINPKAGTWAVAHGNNFVLNPSFEADRVSVGVPTGWKGSGGRNLEGGTHTGRWTWQLNANGTLQQQIAAIPAGTYTLSVWAKASAAGGQLMAKGCGGADSTTPIPVATAYANVKSAPIMISGNSCTVSVSAGSAQVTIDDFVLADQ